jgi:hypothetical protein
MTLPNQIHRTLIIHAENQVTRVENSATFVFLTVYFEELHISITRSTVVKRLNGLWGPSRMPRLGDCIDKSDRWLVDLRKRPIGTSDGSSWRIQEVGREGVSEI